MASGGQGMSPRLTQLEGLIRGAAYQRASTAEIWDAVHSAGIDATFADVNALRSAAVSQRNSMEAIASAEGEQALTADMIGQSAFARDAFERSLSPEYNVRIPYEYTNDAGVTVRDWIAKNISYVPATVEDLQSLAQQEIDDSESTPEGATLAAGLQVVAQ